MNADPGETESERRRRQRRHLIFYLRVYDRENGGVLGFLGDISLDGAMLVSEEPIPVGRAYQLEIVWQDENGRKRRIAFRAVSRWCNNDVNPNFYDTGFQFSDTAPEALTSIRDVIEELGFAD